MNCSEIIKNFRERQGNKLWFVINLVETFFSKEHQGKEIL